MFHGPLSRRSFLCACGLGAFGGGTAGLGLGCTVSRLLPNDGSIDNNTLTADKKRAFQKQLANPTENSSPTLVPICGVTGALAGGALGGGMEMLLKEVDPGHEFISG